MDQQDRKSDGPNDASFPYVGLGIEFIVAVGLPLALGLWLDSKWGSSPWLTLVGLAIGFAAGLYRLIRVAGQVRSK